MLLVQIDPQRTERVRPTLERCMQGIEEVARFICSASWAALDTPFACTTLDWQRMGERIVVG